MSGFPGLPDNSSEANAHLARNRNSHVASAIQQNMIASRIWILTIWRPPGYSLLYSRQSLRVLPIYQPAYSNCSLSGSFALTRSTISRWTRVETKPHIAVHTSAVTPMIIRTGMMLCTTRLALLSRLTGANSCATSVFTRREVACMRSSTRGRDGCVVAWIQWVRHPMLSSIAKRGNRKHSGTRSALLEIQFRPSHQTSP